MIMNENYTLYGGITMTKPKFQYKFLYLRNNAIQSQHGNFTWTPGEWHSVKGAISLCYNGLHASHEPYEAYRYVKGNLVALVQTRGTRSDTYKTVSRSMKLTHVFHWDNSDKDNYVRWLLEQGNNYNYKYKYNYKYYYKYDNNYYYKYDNNYYYFPELPVGIFEKYLLLKGRRYAE